MMHVGGYLEYRGDVMSTVGGYLEYLGDTQYRGEYHNAHGGYHEYRGGVQYRGEENLLLFEYPMVLNIPTVLMISSHVS